MPGVYPPTDHVLSALGIEVTWTDAESLVGRALVDPVLLGRDGGAPGMGPLVPMVDLVAGSLAARRAGRDWLATSDVWMHERSMIASGPVTFDTRLLRAGKRSIVVSVEAEAGGTSVVSSTIEFTRISADTSELATRAPGEPGEWIRLGGGPLLDRPIDEACGLRVVDAGAGVVELARSPFVANSIGTLQGGAVALLADAAAVAMVGSGSRTVDLHVRFLAQTGAGPARTSAELIRSDGSGALVGVEVTDASTDSLVAWASCRVDQPRPTGKGS